MVEAVHWDCQLCSIMQYSISQQLLFAYHGLEKAYIKAMALM